VAHYSFVGSRTETERVGNSVDVNYLKRTFAERRKCKFKDLESPRRDDFLTLLQNDDQLLELFGLKGKINKS